MKVTFVLPFASLSGGTRVVAEHARKLTDWGHDVTVVSQPAARQASGLRGWARRLRGAPARRTGHASPHLSFLGDQHIVLEKSRPVTCDDLPDADAVIATWWETAEWVAALPRKKGRKFHFLQGYEVFENQPAERVIASYALPLEKIAVSGYVAEEVAHAIGGAEIEIVPNGINLAQFQTPKRDKNTGLRVGFLYSSSPIKNTQLAVDALQIAKHSYPQLEVLCFGGQEPASTLPLPSWFNYRVKPTQHEIGQIYASCDLWLFVSRREGFGLPLLEAMASRTPLAATRAGAAPDLVDGKNGRLLEPDPNVFAQEIMRYVQMRDAEWAAISDAAYQTACMHSHDIAASSFLAALQKSA